MHTVLVVEDDHTTRHLIRSLLEKDGFSVQTAGDGREALQQFDRHQFDLVMADVWMPEMNGIELLGRLRQEHRNARIVVITADDTPETLLRIVREQAFLVLRKPVDEKSLIATARSALAAPTESRPIEVVSATPDWVELVVPCQIEAADRIQTIISQLEADLPASVRETVGQAFHELLRNAIEWGGEFDPNRTVRISFVRARRALFYRIADPGQGFRFDRLPHSAVSNPEGRPLDHVQVREDLGLRAGGFGILMARALVDELVYNERHNEVLFVKYLD